MRVPLFQGRMIVAACQGVTIVAGIASKCPFDTWWPLLVERCGLRRSGSRGVAAGWGAAVVVVGVTGNHEAVPPARAGERRNTGRSAAGAGRLHGVARPAESCGGNVLSNGRHLAAQPGRKVSAQR